MLVHHLNLAIETLQSLIDVTKSDITDIKQARHEKLVCQTENKRGVFRLF